MPEERGNYTIKIVSSTGKKTFLPASNSIKMSKRLTNKHTNKQTNNKNKQPNKDTCVTPVSSEGHCRMYMYMYISYYTAYN